MTKLFSTFFLRTFFSKSGHTYLWREKNKGLPLSTNKQFQMPDFEKWFLFIYISHVSLEQTASVVAVDGPYSGDIPTGAGSQAISQQ